MFKSGTEALLIVKYFGTLLFFKGIALTGGIRGIIDHGSAQGSSKDIASNHLDKQPSMHGLEKLFSKRVRVAGGQCNLVCFRWSKEFPRILDTWWWYVAGIKINSAATVQYHIFDMNGYGTIEDSNLYLIRWRGSREWRSARMSFLKFLHKANYVVVVVIQHVAGRSHWDRARGHAGHTTGSDCRHAHRNVGWLVRIGRDNRQGRVLRFYCGQREDKIVKSWIKATTIQANEEKPLPIPLSGESCLLKGITSLTRLQVAWIVDTGGRGGSK